MVIKNRTNPFKLSISCSIVVEGLVANSNVATCHKTLELTWISCLYHNFQWHRPEWLIVKDIRLNHHVLDVIYYHLLSEDQFQ